MVKKAVEYKEGVQTKAMKDSDQLKVPARKKVIRKKERAFEDQFPMIVSHGGKTFKIYLSKVMVVSEQGLVFISAELKGFEQKV